MAKTVFTSTRFERGLRARAVKMPGWNSARIRPLGDRMTRRPLLGRLTYDRYGHLFPEIDKQAAEKLDVCGPLSSP